MRVIIAIILLISLVSFSAQAGDTTWLDKKWKTCSKDTAFYFSLITNEDSLFRQIIYYKQSKNLYQNATFSDAFCAKREGLLKSYSETGILTDSICYRAGHLQSKHQFYENGARKSEAEFLPPHYNKNVKANSWDREGSEAVIDTFYHDSRLLLCHKDTAATFDCLQKTNSGWQTEFYSIPTNAVWLRMLHQDRKYQQLIYSVNFFSNHNLRDSSRYDDSGRAAEYFGYHLNGTPAFTFYFKGKGKAYYKQYWDENGQPLKDVKTFVAAKPAEGFRAWQRNILKQINSDNSIAWTVRKDLYGSVFISFLINETGEPADVVIQTSSPYPVMDALILSYARQTINWKPCRMNGRRTAMKGTHCFTFVKGKVIKYKTLY